MDIFLSILGIFILVVFVFFLLLKYKQYQLNKLEDEIKTLFLNRSALIPSIYEVSKKYINRHNDIFEEILKLRKKEFSEANSDMKIYKILNTKKLIHHEINFIFKICNKHPELINEGKFIYLRNLIMEESSKIGKKVETYREFVNIFNKLVRVKNFTIIGFLFPLSQKINI